MGKSLFSVAVILLAVGLVAAACGGGGKEEERRPAGTAAAQGVVEVEAHEFAFDPAQLTGEVGKALTVEVRNKGQVAHTFTIDELNVDQVLQPGEKATVTLSPSQSGTLAFYCRFHRSRGMEGILDVSGGSGEAAPGGATPTLASGTPVSGYG